MSLFRFIHDKLHVLNPQVRNLIFGHFFLEFMNAGVFILLNIYMAEIGYSDSEIAYYTSLRYLTVVILAYILGRYALYFPMRKVFLTLGLLFPIVSLCMLYSIGTHHDMWIQISMLVWGFFALLMQVFTVPYIIQHTSESHLSEALSYNHATQSIAAVFIGIITYGLAKLSMQRFGTSDSLILFALLGFISLLFFYRLPHDIKHQIQKKMPFRSYDWKRIGIVLTPTILIAVGAGMTIQFMNLFFYNVFHLDTPQYALLSFFTSIAVSIFSLSVPAVRKRLGYTYAITVSQCIAIIILVLLGSTEFFAHIPWMLYVAIALFLFRNPFMNMAAPSTTELSMLYVGHQNREMVASLQAAIWSGSFFISGQLFALFRYHHVRYAYIFYLTGVLYIIGVYIYHILIRCCQREHIIS